MAETKEANKEMTSLENAKQGLINSSHSKWCQKRTLAGQKPTLCLQLALSRLGLAPIFDHLKGQIGKIILPLGIAMN